MVIVVSRQMKKDKKFFLDNLSCGISRMKRNKNIEKLRGPELRGKDKLAAEKNDEMYLMYEDMFPGIPEEDEVFSIDIGKTDDQELSQPTKRISTVIEEPIEEREEQEMFKNEICSVCKNKRPKADLKIEFTYTEIKDATDGFSPTKLEYESMVCFIYRGQLKNELKIVVKQYRNGSPEAEIEFKSEVHRERKYGHKNVVRLVGSCSEGSHRMLVYEYLCNGSLSLHLSNNRREPLTWTWRMKIAVGAAKGLEYLHQNKIIHGAMRPKNILLTHDYEALIQEVGDESSQLEYLAPEFVEADEASKKTDVYAFGVVLLELITGWHVKDRTQGEKSLVGWARPLLRERKCRDLIDPTIFDAHDAHQLFWMVSTAEKCLLEDPMERLSIDKVVVALESISEWKSFGENGEYSPLKANIPSRISIENNPQSDQNGRGVEHESLATQPQPKGAASAVLSRSKTSRIFSSGSGKSSSKVRRRHEVYHEYTMEICITKEQQGSVSI